MTRKIVGVIGLGIMGSAMAGNLVRSGFKVHGFDITPARRSALKRAGGLPCESVTEVGKSSTLLLTSLPSAQALHTVCGELEGEHVVVETSTLTLDDKLEAKSI